MRRTFDTNDNTALKTVEDRVAAWLYGRDHIGTLTVHFIMAAERGEAEQYYEEALELIELMNTEW